jgi:hypothetical protein
MPSGHHVVIIRKAILRPESFTWLQLPDVIYILLLRRNVEEDDFYAAFDPTVGWRYRNVLSHLIARRADVGWQTFPVPDDHVPRPTSLTFVYSELHVMFGHFKQLKDAPRLRPDGC